MRRRKFISFSAAGLAGATFGTPALSSFMASCSNPDRKISAALVGCSDEAIDLLAAAFTGVKNITLKVVFDPDEKKAGQAVALLGQSLSYSLERTADLQAIFSDRDIEAMFLFLPEEKVKGIALQAVEAGKHVYISSEPAFDINEGKQLSEAAAKNKRVVQCGYLQRSNPGVQAAKDHIDQGKLGQVVHVKVFSLQKETGEASIGPAVARSLDLARLLAGNPGHPTAVCGYRTDHRQVVTWDFEKFTITCETGLAYNYMQTKPISLDGASGILPWLLQAERIEVYGAEGLLHLDPVNGSWQVQGNKGEVLADQNGAADPGAHVRNFVTAVRTRELPIADISQARLSASLAHMGNLACQVGNKQLLFDGTEEVFTNSEQANDLLKS